MDWSDNGWLKTVVSWKALRKWAKIVSRHRAYPNILLAAQPT